VNARIWWRGLKNLGAKALRYHISLSRMVHWAMGRLSLQTGRSQVLGQPRTLWIEATNACNLECSICPTGIGTLGRKKTLMTLALFREMVSDVRGSLFRVCFSGYGEPFINPEIFDMLAHAHKTGVYSEVYSNLLLADDEKLRRMIEVKLDLLVVAIDLAPEGQNWRFVRGTDKDIAKVKERLTRLAELKEACGSKLPFVRITYPVTKVNESLLETARQFAKDVRADEFAAKTVNAVVAGRSPRDMKEKWVPKGEYDRYGRARYGKGHCPWPYGGSLVYANGDVSPCCYLARGEVVLGNVFKDGGIRGVWNGRPYQDFRDRLVHNVKSIPVCAACVERFHPI